jgi:uncharacterized lipoprotein YehR (DUF1307 family)
MLGTHWVKTGESMKIKRNLIGSLVALVLTLSVAICAQAVQPADQTKEKDDPSKGSKDVDQTVAYPMDKVLEAARQALDTYGCNIRKEKAGYEGSAYWCVCRFWR